MKDVGPPCANKIIKGLILAVPYGILADTRGRVFVASLGLVGVVCAELWYYFVIEFYDVLPTTAIYAYPLFFIIGGGAVVISAALLAVIADVAPPDAR